MMRVITVVSAAREAIRMSRSYGNPELIYSFPSTAVPPPRLPKKRGVHSRHARRNRQVARAP